MRKSLRRKEIFSVLLKNLTDIMVSKWMCLEGVPANLPMVVIFLNQHSHYIIRNVFLLLTNDLNQHCFPVCFGVALDLHVQRSVSWKRYGKWFLFCTLHPIHSWRHNSLLNYPVSSTSQGLGAGRPFLIAFTRNFQV